MENNYKELKVFELLDESFGDGYLDVYSCRGAAEDGIRERRASWRKYCSIKEGRILYHGDAPKNNETLYRCAKNQNGKRVMTSWFLTVDEAYEAAKNLRMEPSWVSAEGKKYFPVENATFYKRDIAPVPKKFRVKFELGSDGRLFARYNLHPEEDGTDAKGKILFPDKKFAAADIGSATVSVTKEFPGYAFVSGEMDRMEDVPSLKQVLDWAWEKRKDEGKDILAIINHPGRGTYYAMRNPENKFTLLGIFNTESGPTVYEEAVYSDVAAHDAEKYLQRLVPFRTLFAEDVWGPGVDESEIMTSFKESVFYDDVGRFGHVYWVRSNQFHSDLIQKAVGLGVLVPYREDKTSVEILTFAIDQFTALYNFSLEEVKQLAKEMSAVNAKADTRAEQLRKAGKFR